MGGTKDQVVCKEEKEKLCSAWEKKTRERGPASPTRLRGEKLKTTDSKVRTTKGHGIAGALRVPRKKKIVPKPRNGEKEKVVGGYRKKKILRRDTSFKRKGTEKRTATALCPKPLAEKEKRKMSPSHQPAPRRKGEEHHSTVGRFRLKSSKEKK